MRIILKFLQLGFKMVGCMVALLFFFFCCTVTLGTAIMSSDNQKSYSGEHYDHRDIAELVFAGNPDMIRETQPWHKDLVVGGNGGGVDYSTFCGDVIYSPVPHTGVVTYNGFDGVYNDNTMITIKGPAGTATLLHGTYDLVKVGDTVVGGVTPIGTNQSRGNSTGCHAHINWLPNETPYTTMVTGERLKRTDVQHTGNRGNYGTVLNSYNNVDLRISHYTPFKNGAWLEGTTNCDGDCKTMASGDRTESWLGGRGGIQAAACPQEWVFGTRFVVSGQVYECRDRGGWINCYERGDFDPTLGGHTATRNYCWVDLLSDGNGYTYGDYAIDWDFVK